MAGLRTPICDLFGIDVPVFAAGMGGVTLAPLAGAVSRAGGLGVLGATFHTPEQLREEIRAVRRITDRPFGVDLLIPTDIPPDLSSRQIPPFPSFLQDLLPEVEGLRGTPPPPLTLELARAQVEVTLAERVPLMVSALGTPEWLVRECHAAGTKVMSMVGNVRQARRLAAMGVDVIVAQGMEAGGHVGTVTTMVLVPAVVDAVEVPVLAAGGIVDGRGVAAGLMLGAQGAWIGTRFIATVEATAHENHKKRILAIDEEGTVVSRSYTGKTSRVLRNRFTDRWKGRDAQILPMPWQRIWVEPLVAPAKAAGMVEIANFPTGQGAGAITDIPPAAEVFERLVEETREALARGARLAGR
jgi:NAD(P)H-dependent flavin oxidoreductase YrpB (nitropropane dioxygenase family)